tara:strand:- start:1128 stop:2288 length:1161 start_codon:yes stop_codon:yes gene_type:complete
MSFYRISKNSIIDFLFIAVLIIFPKINIVTFRGLYQGIRLEELIVLFLIFYLLFTKNIMLKNRDIGYNFIIYFFIFLACSFWGQINYSQSWIVLIRYLEYIVIILFFNRYKPDISIIFNVLKVFIMLNFIVVILQLFDLVGEFSSLGYEPVDAKMDDRPTGLTGGPWELSNISAIIFFTLFLDKDQSRFSRILFSILCIFLIASTSSRTVVVSFTIASFVFLFIKTFSKEKAVYSIFLFFIFLICVYFLTLFIIAETPYIQVFNMYLNFFLNLEVPNKDVLDGKLWSIAIRIEHWAPLYEQFLTNEFTIFFGNGGTSKYYESTLIRIIFSTGIFGLLYAAYFSKNIPIYLLTFFIISGLTLDMFLSLKIFMASYLFFYINGHKSIK